MDGKGTAILNDNAFEFAKGRARFEAQDFHGEGAHDMAQRSAKEFRRSGLKQLIIEGFIA